MKEKLIKDRLFIKKVADSYVLHRIKNSVLTIEGDSQYTIGGIEPFYKLSLKNCQAIERGYDLDELIMQEFNKLSPTKMFYSYSEFLSGWEKGFQKALELIGDKKFSEEDVKLAIQFGSEYYEPQLDGRTERFIQSLQQTEWDVEIVQKEGKDTFGNAELTWYNPKLDADGCLILKRVE